MKESARVIERMEVALNHADDKVDSWPEWKVKLVVKKVECLLDIMSTNDRREAGRL